MKWEKERGGTRDGIGSKWEKRGSRMERYQKKVSGRRRPVSVFGHVRTEQVLPRLQIVPGCDRSLHQLCSGPASRRGYSEWPGSRGAAVITSTPGQMSAKVARRRGRWRGCDPFSARLRHRGAIRRELAQLTPPIDGRVCLLNAL